MSTNNHVFIPVDDVKTAKLSGAYLRPRSEALSKNFREAVEKFLGFKPRFFLLACNSEDDTCVEIAACGTMNSDDMQDTFLAIVKDFQAIIHANPPPAEATEK